MRRALGWTIAAGLGLTIASSLAWAETSLNGWPTFRGSRADGHRARHRLLTEWPAEGPKLLWETGGAGRGYSSLAIADGKIYTLGDAPSTADDQDEYLLCFELADGKQLWKAQDWPGLELRQARLAELAQHAHGRRRSRLRAHRPGRAGLLRPPAARKYGAKT